MALGVIHKEPLYRYFRASLFSSAFLVKVLFQVIELFIPLVLIFSTQGLWKKVGEFRETPQISYPGRYIIILNGQDGQLSLSSSFPSLNLAEERNLFLTEESWQWTTPDQFNLTYSVLLRDNFTVDSLTYIIFFQYGLNYHSIVKAEVALTDTISQLGSSQHLMVYGILTADQIKPFSDYNEMLIIDDKRQDFEHYKPGSLLSRIASSGLAASIKRKTEMKIPRLRPTASFQLSFNIWVIQDKFTYFVDHWEMLKWAWVQYLAVYYVVRWLCRSVLRTYFDNSSLMFFVSDTPR